MHEAGYVDYLEHLVQLPLLDIIICPFLDYYILSIFHNLGSPLSYHTLIFDLMSSRNMYLYNAYIYTYILLQAKVKYRNEPKNEDLSRSLEINAIWTFDMEFPTIFNKSCTYITFKSAVKQTTGL